MAAIAALVYCAVSAGLALFQTALAAGAPWGRFAWGGQHERLPPRLRVGSVLAIAIYAVFCAVLLQVAGTVTLLPGGAWLRVIAWLVVILAALGVVANAMSRSRPERLVMTPVAALLFILALIVALSP